MDMLIQLLGLTAILAIVWYVLTTLPLPPPVRIAITVVMAIIGIVIVARITGVWRWDGLR